MSHDAEQKLNSLLKSRHFIPAHDDLANRIVTAARSVTQKKDELLSEWFFWLLKEFIHLKPAYPLGLLLTLGLCLGFIGTAQNQEDQVNNMNATHIQDYFYTTRSFL